MLISKPKLYTENIKHPKEANRKTKWNLNDARIRGKIGNMCTRLVQRQLKDTWTAKEMWENLKSKYTADSWYSKWQILNQLEEASYSSSKNISEFGITMKAILEELKDSAIAIKNHVAVKIINLPGPSLRPMLRC